MKKVLVIGSNSFSGSDFVDLLLKKKEYQVIGISRSDEKKALFLPYKKRASEQLKNFRFEKIDLNTDLAKLDLLLEEFQPEYIVNFAAQSEVGPSWENPHHWFQTNAVAMTKLA
ncbi:MAG: GDP-mannose 4,6-dehydratase, partial [Parachlamydiales bacterium]